MSLLGSGAGGIAGFTLEDFAVPGGSIVLGCIVVAVFSAPKQLFGPPPIQKIGGRFFIPRLGEVAIQEGGRRVIYLHGKPVGTVERDQVLRVEDEVTFWQVGRDTLGTIQKMEIPGPRDPDAIYWVNSPRGPHWLPPNRLKLWSSTEH